MRMCGFSFHCEMATYMYKDPQRGLTLKPLDTWEPEDH